MGFYPTRRASSFAMNNGSPSFIGELCSSWDVGDTSPSRFDKGDWMLEMPEVPGSVFHVPLVHFCCRQLNLHGNDYGVQYVCPRLPWVFGGSLLNWVVGALRWDLIPLAFPTHCCPSTCFDLLLGWCNLPEERWEKPWECWLFWYFDLPSGGNSPLASYTIRGDSPLEIDYHAC